ncbi:MAG: hypothetical protein OEM29_05295 [Thermoplasmata archaeon]|nr:hypothetical protein [Thermoplasmata archaeon]
MISRWRDEGKPLVITGFIRICCRGGRQDQLMRKMASAALGVPERVPAGMVPNESAMSGTSADDWPEGAIEARRKASSTTKG